MTGFEIFVVILGFLYWLPAVIWAVAYNSWVSHNIEKAKDG